MKVRCKGQFYLKQKLIVWESKLLTMWESKLLTVWESKLLKFLSFKFEQEMLMKNLD